MIETKPLSVAEYCPSLQVLKRLTNEERLYREVNKDEALNAAREPRKEWKPLQFEIPKLRRSVGLRNFILSLRP